MIISIFRALFKICFPHKSATEFFFSKFYFSSVIVFTIVNYEPNFKEKFLRESGFPILVENFMSQNGNWFFGRHFVIVYPIFNFFAVFLFFWITLSVARISPPNSFGKVLFWVRVHRDPPPPWPLTGVHYTLTT